MVHISINYIPCCKIVLMFYNVFVYGIVLMCYTKLLTTVILRVGILR